jgi:hypothetical protein
LHHSARRATTSDAAEDLFETLDVKLTLDARTRNSTPWRACGSETAPLAANSQQAAKKPQFQLAVAAPVVVGLTGVGIATPPNYY